MEITKLKNGSEEVMPLVQATMLSVKSLLETKPIVFYELVMLCRDRQHQVFGNCIDDLRDAGLVDQTGSVHESIRNIVLSAVTGDGLDMTLDSPIAE